MMESTFAEFRISEGRISQVLLQTYQRRRPKQTPPLSILQCIISICYRTNNSTHYTRSTKRSINCHHPYAALCVEIKSNICFADITQLSSTFLVASLPHTSRKMDSISVRVIWSPAPMLANIDWMPSAEMMPDGWDDDLVDTALTISLRKRFGTSCE